MYGPFQIPHTTSSETLATYHILMFYQYISSPALIVQEKVQNFILSLLPF